MFKKYMVLVALLMSSGLSFGAAAQPAPSAPAPANPQTPDEISVAQCGLTRDEKADLVEAISSRDFSNIQARFDLMSLEQLNNSFTLGFKTWLDYAVEGGDVAAVRYFIDRGVAINAITQGERETPLFRAVASRNLEIVEVLVHAPGINLNILCGDNEMTPLCYAAREGMVVITEVLLAAGASPTIPDNEGNRPLHYALGRGVFTSEEHSKIAVALARQGAFLDTQNVAGKTPIALAQEYDRPEILWALHDAGFSVPKPSEPRPSSAQAESISGTRKLFRAVWMLGLAGSGAKGFQEFKKIKKAIIAENTSAAEKDETVKLITDNAELNKLARQELWKKHKKLIAAFAGSVAGGLADFGMCCAAS